MPRNGARQGGKQGAALPSPDLIAALKATTTRWAAATTGAQSAAPLELATGRPVIGIGGFTSTDPAPSLQQFQQYVAQGDVRYFVTGGQDEGKGDRAAAGTVAEISAWVKANYPAADLGTTTVYDLEGAR